MKISKSILSHAAVFAVGATLAVMVHRGVSNGSSGDATPVGEGTAAVRSSVRSGINGPGESRTSPGRARSEERKAAERASAGGVGQRLAGIVRIGDPLERQSALIGLIGRLGPEELAELAEQYRGMDHFGNSRGEYELILRGWASADPLTALDHARKIDSREDTALVLSTWAGKDAAAAEQWALANHEGDGPNPYMASIIRGVAVHDIAAASRLTEAMPHSRERAEAVDAITRALFVQGAEAALAYPASIQDPQLRAGFVSSIASRLASRDPGKAADWLAQSNDPESQNRAARAVGSALARADAQTAAVWLDKLRPEARAEAARGIIPVMSSADIPGTATWVSKLAGIPNYDRVVEEFVWSCDYRAPEQSAAWIQGISDPEQQTRLYHRMLGEWAKRDAAAVKNWVASNAVPDTVQRRFNR
jgi:hypothetical protein